METQRDRWRQFRDRKTRSYVNHLRLKKPKQTVIEPSEFNDRVSWSKPAAVHSVPLSFSQYDPIYENVLFDCNALNSPVP